MKIDAQLMADATTTKSQVEASGSKLQDVVIEGRRPSRKPLYNSRYASNTALRNMYGYKSKKK